MPKLGDERKVVGWRCGSCGCIDLERVVERFGVTGEPVRWAWMCRAPHHHCSTVYRVGCKREPVYG